MKLAAAEGKAEGLDPAALQARYDEVRQGLGQVSFGYITVPDEATARRGAGAADGRPVQLRRRRRAVPGRLPPCRRSTAARPTRCRGARPGVAAAEPNTGFTTAVPEAGGVVVTFVAGPSTHRSRRRGPTSRRRPTDKADAAGTPIVDDFRKDLGVTVNPRYGILKDGKLVAGERRGRRHPEGRRGSGRRAASDPGATPAK